jgi:hypothetical protein
MSFLSVAHTLQNIRMLQEQCAQYKALAAATDQMRDVVCARQWHLINGSSFSAFFDQLCLWLLP